ncbi:MAG: cupin domain-containing protein [Proteobacteria bacterium]|nr:cupin domain-containing protein [Pseudomonadota bacterium]
MTHAIEVRGTPRQPLGMPAARFLRNYWQKRPLLVRGGFPHFHQATSADDLAGLACEEAALARIVIHEPKRDRWTLRNGPFMETDFAKLPKQSWTLLVQDVDKWDMDVAALLDAFAFIPSWRVDDVMVSYAVDGGGVGAHVDQYDVFLVQGRGQRRWRISIDPRAPKEFRDDTELKLLREFTPTHDWMLEPGDALYLPPGVPHEGTAIGECMTFSVGMRAPSQAELLLDLAEYLAEPLGEERRLSDPDLRAARHAGEIDAAVLARVRAAMPRIFHEDDATLADWFGRFITRYRSAQVAAPPVHPLAPKQLAARLPRSRVLRNPFSRFAWTRARRGAALFVAGERFDCPLALAKTLCARRECAGGEARKAAGESGMAVLAALVNAGHLHLILTRSP